MRLTLTALLCGLILSAPSYSCSCGSIGGCPGMGNNAYPVFLGTVLSVTDLPFTGSVEFLSSRKARIRVDESFGGLAPEVKEVDVFTGLGGGDCGIPFQVGDVYLVAASTGQGSELHVGLCSSTRKIEGSSGILPILRQRRDGKPIPSLAGRIAQYDRNSGGPLGMNPPKALANIRIRMKANGNAYETLSDSAGLYAFYGLPGGQYELAPELPPGTTLSSPSINSDAPLQPVRFIPGACKEYDIEVFQAGSIQGLVLDSKGDSPAQGLIYIPN